MIMPRDKNNLMKMLIILLFLVGIASYLLTIDIPSKVSIDADINSYNPADVPITVLAQGFVSNVDENEFYYFSDEKKWKEFWGYYVLREKPFYDEEGKVLSPPAVDFTKESVLVIATGTISLSDEKSPYAYRLQSAEWVPCLPCPKGAYCETCAPPLQLAVERVNISPPPKSLSLDADSIIQPYQIVSLTPPAIVGYPLVWLLVDGKWITLLPWEPKLITH